MNKIFIFTFIIVIITLIFVCTNYSYLNEYFLSINIASKFRGLTSCLILVFKLTTKIIVY